MKRQLQIQGLLREYMETWRACVDTFDKAWQLYLDEGLGDRFSHLASQTHKEESRADDLRRRVEWELYSKALLPESRGDILGILETVDRLLSLAEWALLEVKLQKLEVPPELRPQFSELGTVVHRCAIAVDEGVRALLLDGGKPERVRELTDRVDELESESDHHERQTIRAIFDRDDLQSGDKVLLRDLVRTLAEVADQGELVANRLMLASVKRRV